MSDVLLAFDTLLYIPQKSHTKRFIWFRRYRQVDVIIFFLLVLLLVFVWCSSGTPIRMRRSLVLIALANRLSGSDCLNWVKAKQHRVETWDPSKGILIKNQRIGRNVYSFVYCIHTIKHYMIFPRFNFTTFYYTNLIECVYVLYVYRRGETRIIGHLRWITNSQSI